MGALVAAYGPLLGYLTRHYGVSLAVAGGAISVHAAGALVGVLVSMRAMERLSARTWIGGALAATATGCAGVVVAPTWPAFLAAAAVIGFGFGALDIGLNQAVAHSDSRRRTAISNGLNGAYGLGAVAGPLLVARLSDLRVTWFYAVVAVLALALLAGTRRISGRLPVVAAAQSRRSGGGALVGTFVIAFALYVGTEIAIGGWMPSHLQSAGFSAVAAATLTSGFWLGLAIGRLGMVALPARVPEPTILLTASGAAALMLIAANVGRLAPYTYPLAGLAMAPLFPTALVWLARLRPGDSRATSWVFPASMIGGIVIPGGIGLVIGRFGVSWAPAVLAAGAALLFAVFLEARRVSTRTNEGSRIEAA